MKGELLLTNAVAAGISVHAKDKPLSWKTGLFIDVAVLTLIILLMA